MTVETRVAPADRTLTVVLSPLIPDTKTRPTPGSRSKMITIEDVSGIWTVLSLASDTTKPVINLLKMRNP